MEVQWKYRSQLVASFLSLGIVASAVGFVITHHRGATNQMPVPVALTMFSNMTAFAPDGKSSLRAVIKRLQRGDGSFKQFSTYYNADGSLVDHRGYLMGIVGWGVFRVDDKEQKLAFMSAMAHAAHRLNENQFRSDPFARYDEVLGFKVQVLRLAEADNSYTESYLAPDLGGILLKQVTVNADRTSSVLEPVKIYLGEPSDFGAIPNYQVDYSYYERQIAEADNRADHELANQMRQLLQQAKNSHRPQS
jgi:hypothetical protein